jgi:2-polyprenyl-6-methoxyphenol hydroxylase-like FAD-dependent oxidoreductase
MSKRALVIGGSLGGLFAANLLLRAGWRVDVFEKTGERSRPAAPGSPPIPSSCAHSRAPARARRVGRRARPARGRARDGSVAGTRDLPQVMTAWGRIYRLLKDVFPPGGITSGAASRVEGRAERAVATFEDGARAEGDLLVAADGIRSTVRMQLAPDVRPQYAGYVAWRGLIEERVPAGASRRDLRGLRIRSAAA